MFGITHCLVKLMWLAVTSNIITSNLLFNRRITLQAVLNLWLRRGVDGFRFYGAQYLVESANITENEPRSNQNAKEVNYWHVLSMWKWLRTVLKLDCWIYLILVGRSRLYKKIFCRLNFNTFSYSTIDVVMMSDCWNWKSFFISIWIANLWEVLKGHLQKCVSEFRIK